MSRSPSSPSDSSKGISQVDRIVDQLSSAYRDRRQIPASEWIAPVDLAQGYRVQSALIERLGLKTVGWKVAATNAAAQQRRGIGEPVFGRLLESRLYRSGAHVLANEFSDLYLETEFAFRFARSIEPRSTGYAREEVADAIDAACVSVELVDSRDQSWRECAAPSLVADNVAHGAALIGDPITDWRSLDLPRIATELWLDDVLVAKGSGAAVLGDPMNAVVWLANRLAVGGETIASGQHVLSGTTCAVVAMPPGTQRLAARFDGLGELEVRFDQG